MKELIDDVMEVALLVFAGIRLWRGDLQGFIASMVLVTYLRVSRPEKQR